MKKRLLKGLSTFLITILVMAILSVSVMAASPTEETWAAGSFNNGAATIGYTINTTNLQVSEFYIDNNSDQPVWLHIEQNGAIIFEMNSSPYSGLMTQAINNFKFHRLPLTDPDDPGSIRYPNNTYIFARYG